MTKDIDVEQNYFSVTALLIRQMCELRKMLTTFNRFVRTISTVVVMVTNEAFWNAAFVKASEGILITCVIRSCGVNIRTLSLINAH